MCGGCGCGPYQNEDGCEGHGHERHRRFLTNAEKSEQLKSYAEELRKELAAVEERINELKS